MFANAPNSVKYGYPMFVLLSIGLYGYWLIVAKGKMGITDANTSGAVGADGTATTGTASNNVKVGIFVVMVVLIVGLGAFLNNKYPDKQ
jgi:hypothetical protein